MRAANVKKVAVPMFRLAASQVEELLRRLRQANGCTARTMSTSAVPIPPSS